MRKTYFGRTQYEISEITLGGGVTGGILINADEATRWAVLQRAVAGGINWIDTAPAYGEGKSEETIGRHLAALSPPPYISTKVRLEAEDLGDIPSAIERSLEQSLTRLQVDHVALLQLHNQLGTAVGNRLALSAQHVLGRGGVANTFDRLREQGLIDATGITAVGDTQTCLEVIESDRFDTAQVYYNALNPSAAWSRVSATWRPQEFCGLIGSCFRLNMGVLAIRVWAGGPLARSEMPARLSVLTEGTDVDNELRCAHAVRATLGPAYGTPAQAALRFTLGNRDLSSRVVGISGMAELEEALDAVERGPLPGEAIAKLDQLWATDFYVK
jgi:D-threo-aldose 1-dehydrogenase